MLEYREFKRNNIPPAHKVNHKSMGFQWLLQLAYYDNNK